MVLEGTWAKAALECTVAVFGLTPSSVLSDPEWTTSPRDLDVVEFWSGVAAVARAAGAAGLRSETFDVVDNPCQDFLLESGFCTALRLALRVKEGGLIGLAPQSSSFIMLDSVVLAQRDEQNFDQQVKDEKHMAHCATFLLCIAIARSAHVYFETPMTSSMFSDLRAFLKPFGGLLSSATTHRCVWSVEPWGERYKMEFKFLHDANWLCPIEQRCPCSDVKMSLLRRSRHKPKVEINGNQRRVSFERLKESRSYPDKLGQAIISALLLSRPPADAWGEFEVKIDDQNAPWLDPPNTGGRSCSIDSEEGHLAKVPKVEMEDLQLGKGSDAW